jgi:hypothetical protein
MVKRNSTAAVRAEKNTLLPHVFMGFVVVLLSAFLVTQAAAQKDPGPDGRWCC